MILNFRLVSLTGTLAGTTLAFCCHLDTRRAPSLAHAFAPAHATSRRTQSISDDRIRRAALGQDWDNGDYLSALSGGRDDIEEANRKYQKHAENREAMNRWRAGKMTPGKTGDGGGGGGGNYGSGGSSVGIGGSSTRLNASVGGNEGAYGNGPGDNSYYSSSPPPVQPRQPQPQQPQPPQYYDQHGNPISLPMVYDQQGNLVPFLPPQPLQPPPVAVVEPPLPPTTKPRPADSPRPVGYNPDAYTLSNTADVYFAQLKRDSKVRKEAWLKGDTESANKVFEDESVKAIGDMWVENPYTRQKNINEAKQQIEGTVRMQMTDTAPRQSTSGMSYRDRLQQTKAQRGGGGRIESFPPPPPPVTPAASDFSQYQQQQQRQQQQQQYQQQQLQYQQLPQQQQPQQQYQPPPPQLQRHQQQQQQQQQFQHPPVAPDPVQGSVASVETVLKMYKEASPEEREALMIPLREALLAAAGASNAAIEGNFGMANVVAANPPTNPAVNPSVATAGLRDGDAFDENTQRLEQVYEALGNAAGKGKFGFRNLSGAEAEELAGKVGVMRTILLDELN